METVKRLLTTFGLFLAYLFVTAFNMGVLGLRSESGAGGAFLALGVLASIVGAVWHYVKPYDARAVLKKVAIGTAVLIVVRATLGVMIPAFVKAHQHRR